MSRHGKVKLSRSKAFVFVAAGALSVATAASATAATWSQGTQGPQGTRGTQGHLTGSAGPAETSGASALEAVGAPRLTLTDQLAIPIAGAADQPSSAIMVQRAYQIRLAKTQDAIARRKAAQRQAASGRPHSSGPPDWPRRRPPRRPRRRPRPAAQPSQAATGPEASVPAASGSPQQIAEAMLASFGWSSSQFSCLDPLWAHESGWSVTAYNAGSGAFGIPQALPGSRMASAGPDWQTNAATQIRWGLEYIKGTYGSPAAPGITSRPPAGTNGSRHAAGGGRRLAGTVAKVSTIFVEDRPHLVHMLVGAVMYSA